MEFLQSLQFRDYWRTYIFGKKYKYLKYLDNWNLVVAKIYYLKAVPDVFKPNFPAKIWVGIIRVGIARVGIVRVGTFQGGIAQGGIHRVGIFQGGIFRTPPDYNPNPA